MADRESKQMNKPIDMTTLKYNLDYMIHTGQIAEYDLRVISKQFEACITLMLASYEEIDYEKIGKYLLGDNIKIEDRFGFTEIYLNLIPNIAYEDFTK